MKHWKWRQALMVMLVACIVLPLSACTSHETATQTKEPNNQAQQE